MEGVLEISKRKKKIKDEEFAGRDDIVKVIIPSGVTSVGERAFEWCYNLKEIQLSDTVVQIYPTSFRSETLERIIVDSNNPVFDSRNDCNAIIYSTDDRLIVGSINTVIPEGIKAIGGLVVQPDHEYTYFYAFDGCNFETLSIPDSVTEIGVGAFSYSNLKSITLPKSITIVDNFAFNGCKNLQHIDINEGVKSIGNDSFAGCNSLEEISIPSSVVDIGQDAFNGCIGLKRITLSEGLKTIGYRAFSFCESLESITIPNSVVEVESKAFESCHNLKEIILPACIENADELGLNAGTKISRSR